MGHFKDYCKGLFGEYNNNIGKMTIDTNKRILYLTKHPNHELFLDRKDKNGLSIGKFYFIKYNYNGNKIWCPIFVIDDRISDTQKRIIYAINIDYLPYSYRVIFFDILFDKFKKIMDYNTNKGEKVRERPLKVNFEFIQKLLKKNGGYEYAITAYDYSKIDGLLTGTPKMFFISMSFVARFIFIDTKKINKKNMKDLSISMDDYDIKNKLNNLINEFNEIKESLDIKDQKDYYKKLKNLEQKYKLFKNNKNPVKKHK